MRATNPTHSQRGVTAVVVAVVLVVLLAMVGLALDGGHLLSVRGEMQNAMDSAALAGAAQLNGTLEALSAAEAAARSFSEEHVTDSNANHEVQPDSIVFGHWTRGTSVATGSFDPITGRDQLSVWRINAVRVYSSQPEPVWLGGFLGKTISPVAASATAVSGGLSEIDCAGLPFVIREGCVLDACPNSDRTAPEYSGGYFVVNLSSDTMDTAGTTNLLPAANVSKELICEILQNENYCQDHAYKMTEGDVIGVGNGDNIRGECGSDADNNSQDDGTICQIMSNKVGTRASVPIVLFPSDEAAGQGESCDGAPPNDHTAVVRGLNMIKIVYVQCAKKADPVYDTNDPEVVARLDQFRATCASTQPATGPQTCVILEYRCNAVETQDARPGGEWFGTSTVMPWLAR